MRSGWQQAPAQEAERRAPFGPEVSWPTGYYDLEYRDGVYSYPAEDADTAPRGEMPYGEHPYAASEYTDLNDFGYGDPGYSDPRYEGPAFQDAGDHLRVGNQWSGAYPTLPGAANDPRYDDPRLGEPTGEMPFVRFDETRMDIPAFTDNRFAGLDESSFEETRYDLPRYAEPLDFRAPGVVAPGVMEPGFGRFDAPAYGEPQVFGEPRYDQTGDFAAVPDYPMLPEDYTSSPVHEETRFDLPALGSPAIDSAAFDVDIYRDPAFDRAPDFPPDQMLPHTGMMLAVPPIPLREQVPDWTGEQAMLSDTMLDMQGSALLDQAPPVREFVPDVREFVPDAPVPVREFVPEAQPEPAPVAVPKKTGKRRSGSRDRRQWVALGSIVGLAAVTTVGVVKYAFPSTSGPAHTIVVPPTAGQYQNKPDLAQQMHVQDLVTRVSRLSNNQATDLRSAVYQYGSGTPGTTTQVFMFIGGHMANSDPATSISAFQNEYPQAKVVAAGPMGGEAACVEVAGGAQGNAAMCVWFDNDTFGTFVSSTMDTAALQNVMRMERPNLEQIQR